MRRRLDPCDRKVGNGREIRAVGIDLDCATFVQLASEVSTSGNHPLEDVSDELTDRGLRTRPTGRHPAGPTSISRKSQLLDTIYYLGLVTYEGEIYEARHPRGRVGRNVPEDARPA